MSYRQIDVNLLPPELQPGPAVRYSLVINFAIIVIVVAIIAGHSFIGMTRLAQKKADNREKREMINSKAQVVRDYDSLIGIQFEVDNVGRLVSLASDEYVDMPVIMDRLARILPDGVFMERISNTRRNRGSEGTTVQVTMLASQEDPQLIAETFTAFKRDSIFHNCFLRVAEYEEHSLDTFLRMINANWAVSGPDLDRARVANQYVFEINALIAPPIDTDELRAEIDNTRFLTPFELQQPPTAAAAGEQPDTDVIGAPEGVVPTEVH